MRLSLAVRENQESEAEPYIADVATQADAEGNYVVELYNPDNKLVFTYKDTNYDTLSANLGNYIAEKLGKIVHIHDIQVDQETERILKLIRYLDYPSK